MRVGPHLFHGAGAPPPALLAQGCHALALRRSKTRSPRAGRRRFLIARGAAPFSRRWGPHPQRCCLARSRFATAQGCHALALRRSSSHSRRAPPPRGPRALTRYRHPNAVAALGAPVPRAGCGRFLSALNWPGGPAICYNAVPSGCNSQTFWTVALSSLPVIEEFNAVKDAKG